MSNNNPHNRPRLYKKSSILTEDENHACSVLREKILGIDELMRQLKNLVKIQQLSVNKHEDK